MATDAEGATKVVKLTVRGAASDRDARRGARQVASSRFWRIVSAKEVATVFAPVALLPTPQAACHALRPAAGG